MKKSNFARRVLVVLGVAVLCLISWLIADLIIGDEPQKAIDITGVCADEKTLYSLSDNYGQKGTVLVFFDLDTGKAVELMERLRDIAPDYPNVDVIAVSTTKGTIAEQKKRLAERNIDFPHILFDIDGEIAKTYQISGTPITYFIDKNGYVQDAYVSVISAKSLKKELSALS